ncbi:acyloxyacyl hydrolase [Subsaximicrobium wynnwilliamsii]|uniref:Acyloxyacyl hydrolase n=1 Tax=Subsaximicrobium wynnwilliamsii TaxID=291179 RepID=A0A5C6ZJQ2_9FLAO|nr:acyloxyacyl hydrolase [Subsaximicrobium wynnwilliamsii]TXD84368.1 acyloxyacyl hydrolase [Subsaximicrobium wynnwilliamsii]TXD90049.1 acyloxyacyl hydrolase [Subsaximicrobium wynnwilliamsii]TXE04101.1 acyloxyacyl hydrolase [Subsaximicrobium wynnwilliamsii]
MTRPSHSVILYLFVSISLYSQTDSLRIEESRPTFIGVNLDYGFLIRHTESLRDMDNSHPSALSVDLSKLLLTQEAWDFCNCFPKLGVNLSYWNWDNPDVLGNGVLAMGYVEPYFRTQKKTNIFLTMGIGGAYLTNPFDEGSNPNNESYSTHLSFALMAGLGINYRLTEKLNIRLAAKYNHTSNGGVSTPNKGLNFPTLSLGVHTSLEDVQYPSLSKIGKREAPEDKTRFSLIHFSGWSNANVGDKDKFYVFGLTANYSRWVGNRSAIMVGTEWIFDYSRKEQIKIDGGNSSFLQGSALVGHEFWLGRVNFSQQLGVYYFNEYRTTDDVYQRYGLTYSFNKHIFAGFNLKAHRHVADFFDLRIGYTF